MVFSENVEEHIKEICQEIEKRYEIMFLEIGADKDHVHFLIQSVPMYSPKEVAQIVKSITAREIFRRVPEVKNKLWGGEFWFKGYFISTVSKHGNEDTIQKYVKEQGQEKEYIVVYKNQISMF